MLLLLLLERLLEPPPFTVMECRRPDNFEGDCLPLLGDCFDCEIFFVSWGKTGRIRTHTCILVLRDSDDALAGAVFCVGRVCAGWDSFCSG